VPAENRPTRLPISEDLRSNHVTAMIVEFSLKEWAEPGFRPSSILTPITNAKIEKVFHGKTCHSVAKDGKTL
jgi:hypothetical protein